jgi:predicted deacetylase
MNKRLIKKGVILIFLILIFLIISIFLIRLFSTRQVDDVSPEIPCSKEIIEKSDVLYVIPKFDNKSISENKEWCDYILNLKKDIEIHGVYHTYEEFGLNRNSSYLNEGINIFEDCFGFMPEKFKPPQMKITENNKELVKINGLKLDYHLNEITHKVYHCNDSGIFSNKLIDIF